MHDNHMRISEKGRYALAACICLVKPYEKNELQSVITLSEKLDISKIYLEQVFALLKRGGIVTSIKGSSGGYKLTQNPSKITAYSILASIETAIFEETKETVFDSHPKLEDALKTVIYEPLDLIVKKMLVEVTLKELYDRSREDDGYMFYI